MKILWAVPILVFALLQMQPSCAVGAEGDDLPWETGYMNLGAYIADMNSTFRLGLNNVGLGVIIDAEKFLGMKSSDSVFRLEAAYRFGESRRHKVDFGWFSFNRRSEKEISEDVILPPEMGGDTLSVGTTIGSIFDFNIIKAKYKYAVALDSRIDMSLGAGLYIMPVKIGMGRKGEERKDKNITAPLPVLGLGVDVVVSRHWLLRQNMDLFFLRVGSFKGSMLNAQAAIEYSNWRHWGVGAGVDGLVLRIESGGHDYPLVDFIGSIEFSYYGAQLYVKLMY